MQLKGFLSEVQDEVVRCRKFILICRPRDVAEATLRGQVRLCSSLPYQKQTGLLCLAQHWLEEQRPSLI